MQRRLGPQGTAPWRAQRPGVREEKKTSGGATRHGRGPSAVPDRRKDAVCACVRVCVCVCACVQRSSVGNACFLVWECSHLAHALAHEEEQPEEHCRKDNNEGAPPAQQR